MKSDLKFVLPVILLLGLGGGTCLNKPGSGAAAKQEGEQGEKWAKLREKMVQQQIEARNVKDKRVLEAMRKVQRHLFVPAERRDEAYEDYPLPIGEGQTISQPYIVAVMSEAMQLKGGEKCLEIGTGSGYQAAILSLLCKEVFTIEIIESLAQKAKLLLKELGYKNVTVIVGDGYMGLPEEAPFDAIMITAAPPVIPQPLREQLKIGGRLVLPLGKRYQDLIRVWRTGEKEWKQEVILPSVIFVPMTGKVQDQK